MSRAQPRQDLVRRQRRRRLLTSTLDEEVSAVTVSMRVMSAGHGYKYLLKSVVHGDGDLTATDALTRYYANPGTPPGRWLGKGVAQLVTDGARITIESRSPSRSSLGLLGAGRDPLTGEPLGRAYQTFATVPDATTNGSRPCPRT